MEIIKAVGLMLVLGAIIGIGLGFAGKKLAVKEDTRVADILAMLPGYNCGGCGFAGCAGCAQALVDGTITSVSVCKPSKPEGKQKIADYLNSTPGPNGETLHVTVD